MLHPSASRDEVSEPGGSRHQASPGAVAVRTQASLREAVVREARSWLGTPYHHMGRVKGAGVDCATLLAEVYARAGALPHVPIAHYPPDWHLHRDVERYLAIVLQVAQEVPARRAEPGDIALFRWGRCFAHGAILAAPWPEEIIHAYAPVGAVTAGRADQGRLKGRDVRFFSVFPSSSPDIA